MKHIHVMGKHMLPLRGETLLEWAQKGTILNSFANALATLAGIKEPGEK